MAIVFISCLLREPHLPLPFWARAQLYRMDHNILNQLYYLFFCTSSLSREECDPGLLKEKYSRKESLEEVTCRYSSNKRVLQGEIAFLPLPSLLSLCTVLYVPEGM